MFGNKWVSGTSYSIIVVNVVVIPFDRFAGGGALRDLAAEQCSASRLSLSPRDSGSGDALIVRRCRCFSRCSLSHPVPLMDAVVVIAQYRGDSSWRLARGTAIHQAAKRPRWQPSWHDPPRSPMWRVPRSQSCIFVRIPFRRPFFACARPRPVWPVSARSFRNTAANCVLIQVFNCVRCVLQ